MGVICLNISKSHLSNSLPITYKEIAQNLTISLFLTLNL